jgi:hypothetical protein
MTKKEAVILQARRVRYYSPLDENVFFEWLNRVPAVTRCEGRGDVLYIHVNGEVMDEMALRELLALFYRYGVDLAQLAVFDRPGADWFHDSRAYWFAGVFGSS